MKVIHLLNSFYGGANIAGMRLHSGLQSIGCESSIVSKSPSPSDSDYISAYTPRNAFEKYYERYLLWSNRRRILPGHSLASPYSFRKTRFTDIPIKTDLIHVVSYQRWLDLPSFLSSVPKNIPVIFTLHDLIPVTAGCSYPDSCQRYWDKCCHCPQLRAPSRYDLSNIYWHHKLSAFSKAQNLFFVANSQWTYDKAVKSAIASYAKSIVVIPNALDLSIYKPISPSLARTCLSLSNSDIVLGFSALSLKDPRKGGEILLNALKQISSAHKSVVLLVMGKESWPSQVGNIRIINLSYSDSSFFQRIFYSALDLFIMPSKHETFGNAAMESISCGTPVVCFEDSGGLSSVVTHNLTGYVIQGPPNPTSLAAFLSVHLINTVQFTSMRSQCRSTALSRFSHIEYAKKYKNFFKFALNKCDN